MNRTRDYYRKMRAKHIKRKKRIVSHYATFRVLDGFEYYNHDGKYSKGKIHCSCPMCKEKAYYGKHRPSIQERRHSEKIVDGSWDYADMVELADTPA